MGSGVPVTWRWISMTEGFMSPLQRRLPSI